MGGIAQAFLREWVGLVKLFCGRAWDCSSSFLGVGGIGKAFLWEWVGLIRIPLRVIWIGHVYIWE